MPQGRRKVAFSCKKKKQQLQAKRQRKQQAHNHAGAEFDDEDQHPSHRSGGASHYLEDIQSLSVSASGRDRYQLKFRREPDAEVAKRKALAHQPVVHVPGTTLEATSEEFYPPGLSYPRRPHWDESMTKEQLDQSENRYFRLFCEKLNERFVGSDELSLYELNLETWRQLWRVMEMSDILLIIADARYPVVQFPPYLYEHIVVKQRKGILLILNKIDLLPPSLVFAWEKYFEEKYPELLVVLFSSMEGFKGRGKSFSRLSAESSLRLLAACEKLVEAGRRRKNCIPDVDLSSWRQKIEDERESDCQTEDVEEPPQKEKHEEKYVYRHGIIEGDHQGDRRILTIGTIGHPNVGKSSLINAIRGKKVVSVSRTPGHTKHFQTIFITKNVKLCDCPGLVFPSRCPQQLQVLHGSYPVAQVRDPVSSVGYIAARIDIVRILKLQISTVVDSSDPQEWTPFLICEAWAKKRGYYTRSKGGRLDASRAANEILRYTVGGMRNLTVCLRPPNYTAIRETLLADPHIEDIKLVQGKHRQVPEELDDMEEGMVGAEETLAETEEDELCDEEVEEESASESEVASDEGTAASAENKYALLDTDA